MRAQQRAIATLIGASFEVAWQTSILDAAKGEQATELPATSQSSSGSTTIELTSCLATKGVQSSVAAMDVLAEAHRHFLLSS